MSTGEPEPPRSSAGDADPYGWAGHRLGLPEDGPGSVAGWGRRIAALLVDWLSSYFVAVVLVGPATVLEQSWVPLAVWFMQVWFFTSLTGASAGQRLLRVTVLRLDHRPVGLWRGLIRTVLIALVIPPLVFDRDGRGLHDLVAGTVVVDAPRRSR